MAFQPFDYLVCLHHRLSAEKELVELSWNIVSTRMHTASDSITSSVCAQTPAFQLGSFEHILGCLHQNVVNIEKDFRAVVFVTFRTELMTQVLPLEAQKRNLVLPSAFNNFVPLGLDAKSVTDLADSLGEVVELFQPEIVSLSKCCLNLLKNNHIFNGIVYVDRLNRKGAADPVGELNSRDKDYRYYKLRGLPFKVVNQDVLNFLELPGMAEEDVQYEFRDHRFSGTAWVRVEAQHAELLEAKNEKHLGSRYIEIGRASKADFAKCKDDAEEMRARLHGRRRSSSRSPNRKSRSRSREERRRKRSRSPDAQRYTLAELDDMGIMKMRGLPYNVAVYEISSFFEKFNPIPHSLRLGYNHEGRKSGEAVLLFGTRKEAKEALELNRSKIGSRYIELVTIRSDEYLRFK